MRTFSLLLFASFALLAGVRDVSACTCMAISPGQAFSWADAVFTGTVAESDTLDNGITARIEISEVFKGELAPSEELRTAASGASCGYEWMEPGTSHVFFADREPDGSLRTGLCTGSAPLEWVPEIVELLRNADGTSQYGPISPGDSWTYELAAGGASMTVRLVDTTVVGDRTYLELAGMPVASDSIFVDGLGNVGARVDGEDLLMLDFTWTNPFGYHVVVFGQPHDVTVERGVTVHLRIGRFSNCIRFRFGGPGDWVFTFAPDVGMVLVTGGNGAYYELSSAQISGTIIAGNENPDRPETDLSLDVYPNPFSDEVTVNLRMPNPAAARVSVFDAQGREVAVLADHTLDAGTTRLFWDVADLPSGVYFVRLVAGNRSLINAAVRL